MRLSDGLPIAVAIVLVVAAALAASDATTRQGFRRFFATRSNRKQPTLIATLVT